MTADGVIEITRNEQRGENQPSLWKEKVSLDYKLGHEVFAMLKKEFNKLKWNYRIIRDLSATPTYQFHTKGVEKSQLKEGITQFSGYEAIGKKVQHYFPRNSHDEIDIYHAAKKIHEVAKEAIVDKNNVSTRHDASMTHELPTTHDVTPHAVANVVSRWSDITPLTPFSSFTNHLEDDGDSDNDMELRVGRNEERQDDRKRAALPTKRVVLSESNIAKEYKKPRHCPKQSTTRPKNNITLKSSHDLNASNRPLNKKASVDVDVSPKQKRSPKEKTADPAPAQSKENTELDSSSRTNKKKTLAECMKMIACIENEFGINKEALARHTRLEILEKDHFGEVQKGHFKARVQCLYEHICSDD